MTEDLKERVDKFNALELPGQMPMMHMGTSYLVNDLWRALVKAREAAASYDRAREIVAQWMIAHSYATGHGDTIEDLLGDLEAYVDAIKERAEAVYNSWAGGEPIEADMRELGKRLGMGGDLP